jgi:hypothetical protein
MATAACKPARPTSMFARWRDHTQGPVADGARAGNCGVVSGAGRSVGPVAHRTHAGIDPGLPERVIGDPDAVWYRDSWSDRIVE